MVVLSREVATKRSLAGSLENRRAKEARQAVNAALRLLLVYGLRRSAIAAADGRSICRRLSLGVVLRVGATRIVGFGLAVGTARERISTVGLPVLRIGVVGIAEHVCAGHGWQITELGKLKLEVVIGVEGTLLGS